MSKSSPSLVRARFFDADDTLFGTIGTQWQKHIYIAREHYGKDLIEEEIRQHYGRPLGEYLCALYSTNDVEGAVALSMSYRGKFPKELFHFTLPTLRRLRAGGQILGLLTSSTRAGIEDDFSTMGISARLFDYTQSADDSAFHKPDPRVFERLLLWLEERAIRPYEAQYVGDSLGDMESSLGAGLQFMGVETGLVTAKQFKEAGALSIPNIEHLV